MGSPVTGPMKEYHGRQDGVIGGISLNERGGDVSNSVKEDLNPLGTRVVVNFGDSGRI